MGKPKVNKFDMRFNILCYTFLLLIILPSCTSIYIATNTVPTGFEESQDVMATAALGINGVHGNIAYTPLNHVYLQGAITSVGGKRKDHHYHFGYQYGLGTYWSIKNYLIEGEFSYGLGEFDHNYGSAGFFSEGTGSYTHYNGTLSFTFNKNENFKHGFSLKAGHVAIIYTKVSYIFEGLIDYGRIYNFPQYGAFYFVKLQRPSGFSFTGQLGSYLPDNSKNNSIITPPIYLRVGLGYRLKSRSINK